MDGHISFCKNFAFQLTVSPILIHHDQIILAAFSNIINLTQKSQTKTIASIDVEKLIQYS